MTKREQLIEKLKAGWAAVPDILTETGWKPHTLRGVVSTLGVKEQLKIERQRVDGITSYRVAPSE